MVNCYYEDFYKDVRKCQLKCCWISFLGGYGERDHLTRMASDLRKMMTKLCLKVHMKSDSAIELAFP